MIRNDQLNAKYCEDDDNDDNDERYKDDGLNATRQEV